MRGASESLGNAREVLRACSACSGDYEDPELTAERDGHDDSETESAQDEELARANELPVSQRTGKEERR